MKNKLFISTVVVALLLSACTKRFEEINTDPYQVSTDMLTQDFNHIGAFYPTMLGNLFGHQIEHNLVHESFVRHLATPTPFVGGINNTTYYIRWNTYWNRIYGNIMAPSKQVIALAQEGGYDVFEQWAIFIRILGISRLSAYHGPVIYSDYGSTNADIYYDSEQELYTNMFAQMDKILEVFKANLDYTGMKAFDATYGGNIAKWIKMVNSTRLQLAIRISKVDPVMAKTQGEKALNDDGGLIETNADNCLISLYGGKYPPAQICFEWNDTRMDAGMESILVGYKDPRIEKFFDPVADAALVADHPDFPYKGIRNGAQLVAKDDHTGFSTIDESFKSVTNRRLLTAAEVAFNKAEAALRGWSGAGDAQTNYEDGVRLSFADWGAGGVDEYLADATSTPIDYNDPVYAGGINDFVSRIDITIKWDNGATNEQKLERIITQKWIASYTNTIEIWCDHRRTGYPKLPYNYQNDSNADWGVIADDDFLRRMPFIKAERDNNPNGVADATSKLGGPDEIGTRLWWDTGGSNF